MKKLVLTALFVATSYAAASDLNGRQLSCTYFDGIDNDVVNTTYVFSKSPGGQDVVQIFTDNDMNLRRYSLNGAKLSIDNGDILVYDLSNPTQVNRPFKKCVMPGQGGGDARPFCVTGVESCQLK